MRSWGDRRPGGPRCCGVSSTAVPEARVNQLPQINLSQLIRGTEPAPRTGMSFMFKRVGFLLPAVLGLAAGCGGSNLVLPSEGVAAKMATVSGDKQAGIVGVPLVANL